MSELRFSCPHCGQTLTSDTGYAGQQLQCPSCGQLLLAPSPVAPTDAAPAVPPGNRQSAGALRPPGSTLALVSLVLSSLSLFLWPFGFVPGIICGHIAKSKLRANRAVRGLGYAEAGLKIGYGFLGLSLALGAVVIVAHTLLKQPPARGQATSQVQTKPSPELQQADADVQQKLKAVLAARDFRRKVNAERANLHGFYHGKNLDHETYARVMQQYKLADDAVANAETAYAGAKLAFDASLAHYQQLGGTNDYNEELQ